jgi:hypothetical protein
MNLYNFIVRNKRLPENDDDDDDDDDDVWTRSSALKNKYF